MFGEVFTHGEKVRPNIAEEDDEAKESPLYFSLSVSLLSHQHRTALSRPAFAAQRGGTGHMHVLTTAVCLAVS
jgi:hypothetical protein